MTASFPAPAGHPAAVTVAAARRNLMRRLSAAGIDNPGLDARILVAAALGLSLTGFVAAADRPLGAAELQRIDALAARRLRREPVARITGTREFWGLPFAVSADVLVPRPDTETVVEQALAVLAGGPSNPRIADLGTGSGCILIALLTELPGATGVGTDRDSAVLAAARANAGRLGVAARAGFVACDFGAALAAGGCDAVVTNPPYVRTSEIATLAPEVRAFDPLAALDGGADGLQAYRVIAAQAGRVLRPGGVLVAEIGHGQAPDVTALFAAAGFAVAAVAPDLAGIDRAVVMRRAP